MEMSYLLHFRKILGLVLLFENEISLELTNLETTNNRSRALVEHIIDNSVNLL